MSEFFKANLSPRSLSDSSNEAQPLGEETWFLSVLDTVQLNLSKARTMLKQSVAGDNKGMYH